MIFAVSVTYTIEFLQLPSCHLLYMGFDELDFFFIQAVFDIELLVNFGDGF